MSSESNESLGRMSFQKNLAGPDFIEMTSLDTGVQQANTSPRTYQTTPQSSSWSSVSRDRALSLVCTKKWLQGRIISVALSTKPSLCTQAGVLLLNHCFFVGSCNHASLNSSRQRSALSVSKSATYWSMQDISLTFKAAAWVIVTVGVFGRKNQWVSAGIEKKGSTAHREVEVCEKVASQQSTDVSSVWRWVWKPKHAWFIHGTKHKQAAS